MGILGQSWPRCFFFSIAQSSNTPMAMAYGDYCGVFGPRSSLEFFLSHLGVAGIYQCAVFEFQVYPAPPLHFQSLQSTSWSGSGPLVGWSCILLPSMATGQAAWMESRLV
jgi:hypothetical protein